MKTDFCKKYDSGDIKYEIVEHLGVIAEYRNGWRKELNIVYWNDSKDPKYDIRQWSADHTQMSRGLNLFYYEFETLCDIIKDMIR